ncbi:hypothetical protein QJQ45_014707 [Haematococcus lacustris]|nr:hypothetical protein QJQ45_014707 [Haematococcus lacustris]
MKIRMGGCRIGVWSKRKHAEKVHLPPRKHVTCSSCSASSRMNSHCYPRNRTIAVLFLLLSALGSMVAQPDLACPISLSVSTELTSASAINCAVRQSATSGTIILAGSTTISAGGRYAMEAGTVVLDLPLALQAAVLSARVSTMELRNLIVQRVVLPAPPTQLPLATLSGISVRDSLLVTSCVSFAAYMQAPNISGLVRQASNCPFPQQAGLLKLKAACLQIATSLTMGSRTIPALYIPACAFSSSLVCMTLTQACVWLQAIVTADSSSLSNTWLVCTPSGSINVGPPSTTLAISTQYMVARLAGYGISSTVSDTSTLMAAVASMGPQLRLGAAGQVLLQEPMSLAAANSSWPATQGIGYTGNLTLANWDDNRLGWLDLNQDPLFVFPRSNTSQLVLANMVVMNTCGITRSLDPNTPNQRTIQAGPILPVTRPSISLPRSQDIPAVVLSNVVLVLPDQELQMHHYWGPLMASSLIAPNFLNNIGVLETALQRSNRTAIYYSVFRSPLVLLDNVLITSQLPPGAPSAPAAAPARGLPFQIQPTRDCLTGTIINPSTIADSNLFWINNDAAMTAAMVSITLSTGDPSSSIPSIYPPLLLMFDSASLTPSSGGLVVGSNNYQTTRTILISGPTSASRQVGPAGAGQSWSNVTLGLSKLVNMLTIGPTSALHIQGVTLDQLATLDLSTVPGQPSNTGTSSIQRHALPLWAFGASRVPGQAQLQVSNCTVRLSVADFAVLYQAAIKGTLWKAGSSSSNRLIQNSEVFDVLRATTEAIVFRRYMGWGLNLTNSRVEPVSPYEGEVPPPPTPAISIIPGAQDDASSNSNASIIGGVVGGVGAFLLVVLAVGLVALRARRASRYHTEAAAAKVLVGMKDTSYVPASYIGSGGYRGVDSLMGRPSHISQGFDGPLKYDPGTLASGPGALTDPLGTDHLPDLDGPQAAAALDMSMLNTSQGGPDPSTTLAAWRVFYKANASLGHTSAGGQTLGTSFLPPSSNPQYPGAYGASLTPSLTHSTDYSKPDSGSTQQHPQTAPSSSKTAPRLPHITVTNPDIHPVPASGISAPVTPGTASAVGHMPLGTSWYGASPSSGSACHDCVTGAVGAAGAGVSGLSGAGGSGKCSTATGTAARGSEASSLLSVRQSKETPLTAPTDQPQHAKGEQGSGAGHHPPDGLSAVAGVGSSSPDVAQLPASPLLLTPSPADPAGVTANATATATQAGGPGLGQAGGDPPLPQGSPSAQLVGTDRPSAARRKAEAASGAAELWDPNKEIATLAGQLAAKAAGDKLVLLEAIGQGGFGTVYRGKWRGLEVAVKTVLFTDHAKDSKVRGQRGAPQQRAILEAAVCTSVTHNNVVATYHYDITAVNKGGRETRGIGGMTIDDSQAATDWKLYLVQEYCSASLQDALSNRLLHNPTTLKPDMDLVLSILMDIARGMDYIHCNNIIHGDLTPGNVLLKQAAESPIGVVSKITDFGLCTTIEAGQSHISNITNGTPFYVAPEVVNSGQLTKTSDVYSFGVLMWELYRCMPPWVKTDTGYVGNKRFRRFPIDTPRPYVALCAQCLERSSKARPTFTQALDMLTAMHTAYLAGYDGLELPQQSPSKPQLPVFIPPLSPPSTSTSPATNSPPPLPPNQKPSQTAIQPKEEGGAGPGGKPAAITPGTPTASTAQAVAAAAATGLHLAASPSQGGGHGSGAAAGTEAQAVAAGTSMVVATHDGVLKINSQPRSQAFVRLFASGLGSGPAATSGALGGLGVPHSAYKRQSAADLAKATADAWAARELVVAAVTEPDKTEGGMSGVPEGEEEGEEDRSTPVQGPRQ